MSQFNHMLLTVFICALVGVFLDWSCQQEHRERCAIKNNIDLVEEKDGCRVYHFDKVDDKCYHYDGYYTTCEGEVSHQVCEGVPVQSCHLETNKTKRIK